MGVQTQQVVIAYGVTVKGAPQCLYIGTDIAKAKEASAKAGPEFSTVAVMPKGSPALYVRYPARNAAAQVESEKAAEAKELSALNAKKLEAEAKTAQAKRLHAEAAAITKELSKSDK